MILIASAPNKDYPTPGRVYRSDHRQMIYDVAPDDLMALLDQKCELMKPVVTVHWFPNPVSIHCGACGAFMEPGDEEINVWFWLKRGSVLDFLEEHCPHAEANLVAGWPRWPVTAPARPAGPGPSGDMRPESGWSLEAPAAKSEPTARQEGYTVSYPGIVTE